MTTVLGIRPKKVEVAVLVADRQVTQSDQNSGMVLGKYLTRKLWVGKDKLYCFGQAGDMNPDSQNFMKNLADGKYDVEKVVKEGYFPELRELNLERMGRRVPNNQRLSSLILATRFQNNPRLYTCFPLGEVGERGWVPIGSGEEKINQYMSALMTLGEARDYLGNGKDTTTRDIIRIGLEAVRRSQGQDIYSQGLDMLVCTPEGINDHFAELGDDFGKKLKRIQGMYK